MWGEGYSRSVVQIMFSTLGQCYLDHLAGGGLSATDDGNAMVEGRDESGVDTKETTSLGQDLRVGRLFHFQLVGTTTASTKSVPREGGREGGREE